MAHILIIDDDDSVRTFVRAALRRAGHEVSEAADGKEGVDRFMRLRPDAVVCDLFMPVSEGIETIRELRAISQVGILAISGCPFMYSADLLDVACRLGATAALAKPFSVGTLIEAVDGLLRGAASRDWCEPLLGNLVSDPVTLSGSGIMPPAIGARR